MNCARVSRLLSSYIDGELPGSEMIQVRNHLDHCQSCSEEIEGLRMVKKFTSEMRPAAPSPHLEAAILKSLETVTIPTHTRLISMVRTWASQRFEPATFAVAGCAVLLMAMLGHFPRSESFVRDFYTGGVTLPAGTAVKDGSPAFATAALSNQATVSIQPVVTPTMGGSQTVPAHLSGLSSLPETRTVSLSSIGFAPSYSILTNR